MSVCLINASAPSYNLGLMKAHNYWQRLGAEVTWSWHVPSLFRKEIDLVWISAIFSWDVPSLIEKARLALECGVAVEVGGCGTHDLREYIYAQTGLIAQSTPDARFEREPGAYKFVFWSRGCPAKNCSLGYPHDGEIATCSVPSMEGERFTLYTDVTPASIILDNNLSALPRAHQELIIDRTLSAGFKKVDANSGFEPHSFRPDTAERWKHLPLVAWRFAYDELSERDAVLRMIQILDSTQVKVKGKWRGVPRRRLRIYCLAGNEPIAACEQRVREIHDWKCVPVVQRRRPLNWLGEPHPLPVLFDWTEQKLKDFQRWGNRLARNSDFIDYKRSYKDGDKQTLSLF